MKDKLWLGIIVFLLIAFLSGAATLAIQANGNEPVEISLSQTRFPEDWGEICITGAVASPGYYTLREDDRLSSLVLDAGLLPEADVNSVKIYVPSEGEMKSPQKIDLNRAEVWLLETLPGIGPSLAQAIVDYRNEKGRFDRVEDLLKVKGIGPTTLERIKERITVAE